MPNKSIKELKRLKIRQLAELKIVAFAEAEKQNEEIKRLKQRTERENVGGMNSVLAANAPNWLV